MIEAKTVLDRINGGKEFKLAMEEFGGLGERLLILELGVQKLLDVCQAVREVEGPERVYLCGRVLALFYPDLVAGWWAGQGGVEGIGEAVACLEENILNTSDETDKLYLYLEFARLASSGDVSPADRLVELCNNQKNGVRCLKILAEGLFESALTEPTAFLTPCEKDGFLELSFRPKGLSPDAFLSELGNDLENLRTSEDPRLGRCSIVGYSWLLDPRKQKTTKMLDRLGLGAKIGSEIVFFDPNEDIACDDEYERRKIALAAMTAISLAPVSLARFLRNGRVPRIGRIIVRAEDFWK